MIAMDKKDKSSGRILIIRNSALGDVAMTIPVIYSFARAYPEKEIYVLTRPLFAKLFVNAPENVHLIKADYKKDYDGMAGNARLLKELKRYRFSEVADFHDVMRSWMIDTYFALRGKRVSKLDKDRDGRINLLKDRNIQVSYIDRYVKVLNRLGYTFDLTFDSVFGAEKPKSPVDIKHPALGIAPFARYKTKEYPLELLNVMIDELEKKGVNIYLFGGKENVAEIEKIVARHTRCVSMAGKYQIEDELKIMGNMDLMLSMDSANQHMAALAGVKCLSLWGSTVPYGGFQGYNQNPADAFWADLDCQPCSISGKAECPLHKDSECMRRLNRSLIVDTILDILKIKK